MALATTTLKVARSDLRSRLAEISNKKFEDSELNRWLNVGQQVVYSKLKSVIGHWYGETTTTSASTSEGVNSISISSASTISEITAANIRSSSTSTSVFVDVAIPANSLEDLHNMKGNTNYDSSASWLHHGEKLYYHVGSGLTSSFNRLQYFYHEKPTDTTSDSTAMDLPEEYIDLVTMAAQSKALAKINMLGEKRGLDQALNDAINDVIQTYGVQSQQLQAENEPGVQTARRR